MKYLSLACISILISINVFGQKVIKDIDVKDFTAISVSGGFDVEISQGDKESLNMEYDSKIEKDLVVEVVDKTLKIYLKKNVNFSFFSNQQVRKARIVVKNINKISLSGGGDLVIENLELDKLSTLVSGGGDVVLKTTTNDLTCSLSGGGSISLSGKADNLVLHVSGGGDVVSKLNFKDAKFSTSGGGSANMYCKEANSIKAAMSGGGDLNMDINTKDLKLSISGGGDASIKGDAKDSDIIISGGGSLSAEDFEVENCILSLSGGGDASVYVSAKLTLAVSSGGEVSCYGKPSIINKKLSGGSELRLIK